MGVECYGLRTVRRIYDRGSDIVVSQRRSGVGITAYPMSQLRKCRRCCDQPEQDGSHLCSWVDRKAKRGTSTVRQPFASRAYRRPRWMAFANESSWWMTTIMRDFSCLL